MVPLDPQDDETQSDGPARGQDLSHQATCEALRAMHGDDFVGYDDATETVVLRERRPATTASIEITCPELTAIDLLEHLGRTYCWRLHGELRALLESDAA